MSSASRPPSPPKLISVSKNMEYMSGEMAACGALITRRVASSCGVITGMLACYANALLARPGRRRTLPCCGAMMTCGMVWYGNNSSVMRIWIGPSSSRAPISGVVS
eukprot:6175286-Pleurochrysis_carterae.AAC.3